MSFYVNQAVEKLEDVLNNTNMEEIPIAESLIREALEGLREEGRIYISWEIEDIINRAEVTDREIPTREKCIEILKRMERSHNAEIGITWDTIDYLLDEI